MKNIAVIALAFFMAQPAARADHKQLPELSRQLGIQVSQLADGARKVIGFSPSFHQRYAHEHVQFFHASAHRFQDLVSGMQVDRIERDHTNEVRLAFRKLNHDASHARETFMDLFGTLDDHPSMGPLEKTLRNAEFLVRQIGLNLP